MSSFEGDIIAPDDSEQLFKGLSWSQRIQGYAIFLSLGIFATMMSWIAISFGWYWKYTVLSTLGSIMSVLSTVVLMGPSAQLAYMFDDTRKWATTMYLGSLIMTLIVAFAFKSFFLCFLCGILQFTTLLWYSLSYIPYGREAVITYIFKS